jgi:hypothetical protein
MRKVETKPDRAAAEALAVKALTFLVADPAAIGRFLAESGLGPGDIRAAAKDPGFLLGVIEFVRASEPLLLAFTAAEGVRPADIDRAHRALGGRDWERETA